MKISKVLQEAIANGVSLLVATGKEEAHIYLAHDDEVHQAAEIVGCARHRFFSLLEKKLIEIIRQASISRVYLFTPLHDKNLIAETLPYSLKQKIIFTIPGNHVKHSPLALLTLIATRKRAQNFVLKAEAHKILSRGRQAREVIGKKIRVRV